MTNPTDEEIMELMPQQMRDDLAAAARALAGFDRANVKAAGAMRIILNRHAVDHARAALAKWGTLPPQPVWADIHYAWELEDAEGEWQAGGSANSLEDVQREGNRYLQTYSQDGPHKLIIRRHCVTATQAIIDASNCAGSRCVQLHIADALRALAVRINGADAIRQDVLDIAAELEDQ
jgi:hypothetical protein